MLSKRFLTGLLAFNLFVLGCMLLSFVFSLAGDPSWDVGLAVSGGLIVVLAVVIVLICRARASTDVGPVIRVPSDGA